jgi:hypothetical protein
MKSIGALAWAVSVLYLVGCGGVPPPPQYTPDEQYALLIKRKVADLTEGLQRNPKDAREAAEAMTADLGQYEAKSAPADKAIYVELQKTHKELLAAFARSAPAAELQDKVRKIEALVKKLPGPG